MSFGVLDFLSSPAFVASWYDCGAIAALWVLYDTFTANRHVMPAMKAAWPVIVLFFSIFGLALYLTSCRPPRIGSVQRREGDQRAARASCFRFRHLEESR